VEADPSRTRDRLPSVVPLPVCWVGYTCPRARGKRCRFGGSRVRGVGTDIVAVSRLARSLRRRDGFAETVFCSDERRFCDSQRYPEYHYAARFAAKEAFLKALGLGVFSGSRSRTSRSFAITTARQGCASARPPLPPWLAWVARHRS
jgi:phosphopantetheine--protein transferase-like protein